MNSERHGRLGPAAIIIIGLVAITLGALVKTGFIEIRRGGVRADSGAVAVRTGAGEVEVPLPTRDSARGAPTNSKARPTPAALASDTLLAATDAAADSNAVRPTPVELAELASRLIVPVAGIQPDDLLDTFDEARGGGARRHNALDIPAPRGTAVLSATDGRVQRLFSSAAGGLMVYASDPSDHFVLMYAHLDRYADGIANGMPLQRGDTIGYVGTTGNAPPDVPHLHFAIARTTNVARWWTGMPVDPRPLLRR
jgi:peptidoglycan LD-endopeptidase LytH